MDRFVARPVEIAFQSANAWDSAGVASFDFPLVWISRFDHPRECLPYGPYAEPRSTVNWQRF